MRDVSRLRIATLVALVATILAVAGMIIAGRLPEYIDIIHVLEYRKVTPATQLGETMTTIGFILGLISFVLAGVRAPLKFPASFAGLMGAIVPIFPVNLVIMVAVFLMGCFITVCLPIIPIGIELIKANKEEVMYF